MRLKKYHVYGTITGGMFLGSYMAETKEKAIENAVKTASSPSFCHQCSSNCEDAEITEFYAEEEMP